MPSYDAYLVTWSHEQKPWPELPTLAQQTANGKIADEWWNVSSGGIASGARIFLLKQGMRPVGILGSGTARTSSSQTPRPHWNDERKAAGEVVRYIEIDWDVLLDPEFEPLLTEDEIRTPDLPERLWNARNSGNGISRDVVARLEQAWANHVAKTRGFAPITNDATEPDDEEFPEGGEVWKLHRSFERHPGLAKAAKAAALARGERLICCICQFDFQARYGAIGEGYIECHHIKPVSELAAGSKTLLSDVVLVCSNCHRMLHRKRPWLGNDELKSLMID